MFARWNIQEMALEIMGFEMSTIEACPNIVFESTVELNELISHTFF